MHCSCRKAWITIVVILFFLLLLSVLLNIKLACRSCTNKRHKNGQYASIPLEEINGGTKDRGLPAAWEVDDPSETAWDSNQTESVKLL